MMPKRRGTSAPALRAHEDCSQPRRGYPPKPVVEFPEPISAEWEDVEGFDAALRLHMARHSDSSWHLYRAVVTTADTFSYDALKQWTRGSRGPRSAISFEILGRVERRYRLPDGYFRTKLSNAGRATTGRKLTGLSPSDRRRFAWHLPDDFDLRPKTEQERIVQWVRDTIITGATDFRRFQAKTGKHRFGFMFGGAAKLVDSESPSDDLDNPEILESRVRPAPAHLAREMSDLLRFKTATLAPAGLRRAGVWGSETAAQRTEHLGLLFGAFSAPPASEVKGFGATPASLCFGMLVFPAVWDWYLRWREERRGFYTKWEVDMLALARSFVHSETGWLRQNPNIADGIVPIPDLINEADIALVRSDWVAACDKMHKHAVVRSKEIERVARVHRDPFEPILPILEAESPVREYRKITQEILRMTPDPDRHPRAAAETVRSFLMLRFGLHLGLRQRNLRELMLCRRDHTQRTERQLEAARRGEIRWNEREIGWEVLIPSAAFKNAGSSFFGNKPFRLVLPDLDGLYPQIEAYIDRHRRNLLGPADDPGTFFVKTAKRTTTNAAYDQNTFYEAWRLTIQRYGIYNPYTDRGAIKGLLPHGPHNIRDVLATHILKQTGSFEQASYAIQDTPDMVAKHYGRFLPHDKSALAAQILNRVWT